MSGQESMAEALRAEADLYADYETEHADLLRAGAAEIERLGGIVKAAEEYRAEVEHPAPDLLHRSTLLRRLFEALDGVRP